MRIDVENTHSVLNNNYVLLLTTNSAEKQAVNASIGVSINAAVPAPNDGAYVGRLGGQFVVHICGTSGAQQQKSVSAICSNLLGHPRFPRPTVVIVCGVAWGNPKRLAVADVLLSSEVLAINQRRENGEGTIYRPASHQSSLPHAQEILASIANEEPRTFEGPIASGETYFGDTAARDALLAQHSHILAGDMESFAIVNHIQGLPWLVVRAISDLGATGTTREAQNFVARSAASILPKVIERAVENGAIPANRDDLGSQLLGAVISGDALRVNAGDAGKLDLSWYLNDVVAPLVLARLSGYPTIGGNDHRIARDLCDLLMETTQNALRHGGATNVTLTFCDTSVELCDDGRAYNLADLTGSRGGATAWRRLQELYVCSASIAYLPNPPGRPNRYAFKFERLDRSLSLAKTECQAVAIDPWQRDFALQFNESCEAIFFDTTQILMTSIRHSATDQLRAILEGGKTLYLRCSDEYERSNYERDLADFKGPQLYIFTC